MKSTLRKSSEVPMRKEYDFTGGVVGKYARRYASESDLASIRSAGEQIDAMIAAAGTTEDELVQEFDELRRQARKTNP